MFLVKINNVLSHDLKKIQIMIIFLFIMNLADVLMLSDFHSLHPFMQLDAH